MSRKESVTVLICKVLLLVDNWLNSFAMPWRSLMRYLSNNEELIRRLSESYPIRRAAQLTAYFYHSGKDKFLEHRGKYERAGGWEKTKRDTKNDLKEVQHIGKEYLSSLFRPYTDTWASYKESRREQEQEQNRKPSSSSTNTTSPKTTTTTTTKKKSSRWTVRRFPSRSL